MTRFEGVQSDVLHRLVGLSRPAADYVNLIVVTGDTGTGKSTVLRTLSRSLSMGFLNDVGSAPGALPILMLLQTLRVAGSTELWNEIVAAWLERVRKLTNVQGTREQFDRQFERGPTALILDSLDEFLMTNRRVSRDAFRSMVHELQSRYGNGGRLSIVIGIRWGDPILAVLESEANHVLQVQRLTEDQAREYFPKVGPVIDKVLQLPGAAGGEDPLSWVLTPFVLSEVESMFGPESQLHGDKADETLQAELEDLALDQEHQVTDLALRANIRKAGLHRLAGDDGVLLTIDDCKMALSFIAMIYSTTYRVEMMGNEIAENCKKMSELWATHQWSTDTHHFKTRLDRAFGAISSDNTRGPLFNNTVFRSNELAQYRFKHREWTDYLLGCYFAFAWQCRNLQEVTRSSFSVKAHAIGGKILVAQNALRIDKGFADALVVAMQQQYGHFVVGNLGALLGKSTVPIDRDALDVLFDPATQRVMPTSGRMVLLGGLGYRLLRRNKDDKSLADLETTLVRTLRCHLQQSTEGGGAAAMHGHDRVTTSLAFCYLKALGLLDTSQAWPGLELSIEQELQVVDHLHNERTAAGFRPEGDLSPVYKTCQMAFYNVQVDERENDHRPVSLVHYLYTLALAIKHRAAIRQIREDLPQLLANPDYAAVFQRYHQVPEVFKVLERCRTMVT